MNKKNKLMKALVGLELSNKAKQAFCDIVLSKNDSESDGGGAGTESVSKYIKGIEYYAVDYDKLVELGYDSTVTSMTTPSGYLNQILLPACGGKLFANGAFMILGPGMFDFYYKGFGSSISITGIYYISVLQQNPEDPSVWQAPTFKEFITYQPLVAFSEAFTEITEEEFYQGIEEA